VKAPSDDIVIHPDCIAAVREAAALCESLGHEVEEASPAIQRDMLLAAFVVIWAAGNAATLDAISLMTGRKAEAGEVEPLTWALCEMGRKRTASEYLMSVQVMQGVGREMAGFFQSHDIWLTPTVQEPPVPLGTFDSTPEDALAGFTRSAEFVPFTPVCNASGQPAMSMPLFWNADGLPVGTHFVARFGEEATLFRLASQLERARPWADRRPTICA
jgi:amidase